MGISKDLSQTPYFDDFNEDKNFHRVLFKPSTAVQARELNQMQTILQDQVERFGENILIEGTIVAGGNFKEINPLEFVKVLDNDTDNRPIVLTNYVGLRLRGKTSGVTARVVTFKTGFQSQENKNTLYVKYTSANSSDDQSVFDNAEQIEVLNNDDTVAVTLTVAGTRDTTPTGSAYGIVCGEGVIFQKGHFIKFYEQTQIVSRYDTTPDSVVVGFDIEETVVDSFQDTSLLDNAAGFNNEQAPGADRLKLTPNLVVLTLAEAAERENFFVIQEYQNGRIVRRNDRTKFNSIGQEISRRTVEESGNYTVTPFNISIGENASNSNVFTVGVGSGVAYVEGNRVEVISEIKTNLYKSTQTFGVEQQNTTTVYGNYYNVTNLTGEFPVETLGKVELIDDAAPTPNVVGTARVRAIRGTTDTEWRMYLFDVEGGGISNAHQIRDESDNNIIATIALDGNGNPQRLISADSKVGIWSLGKPNIANISGTPDYTTFVQETFTTANNGVASISRSGDWFWRDTSVDSAAERDYTVIRSNGTPVVPSDFTISNTTSDTDSSRNITIPGDPSTTFSILLPVKRKVVPATKELETIFVRVNANTHNDLTSGNFSLGVPDVFEIENIWKGANTTFTEADAGADSSIVSVKSQYNLIRNQKDSYYDYSYIEKKSASSFTTGDCLLIKAKVFKKTSGSTVGYFSVDSYPVDDSTSPAVDTIKTYEIPSYTSDNGSIYNLRDSIDFRPYPAGVTYNTTEATASVINDTIEELRSNISFGVSETYFPIPGGQFESDYNYYVGRIDKVYLTESGAIEVTEGNYSDIPQPPSDPIKGMVVAEVNVTPFPTLPSSVANKSDHPEYAVSFIKPNNRRYTMGDISKLDKRIKQLEYYTTLNALESDAEDYVIQDADGLNRFKNGIFVDNFRNLLNANLRDPAFSTSVSKTNKELSPRNRQYYLDMEVESTSGVTKHNDITTLPYVEETLISQPFATRTKSCTTDFYRWTGTMRIYPEYDGGPDVTVAPDIQLPDTGLVEAFSDYTDALMELSLFQDTTEVTAESTRRLLLSTVRSGNGGVTRTYQNETTTDYKHTTHNMDVSEVTDVTAVEVGDFITDVSFKPYLRSQDIEIEIFGMMPNKRVYFYFDEVSVDAHIAKAQLLTEDQLADNQAAKVQNRLHRTSEFSADNVIRADANGVVRAIFRIPAETFYVGDRKLEVTSAIQYQDTPNANTYAIRTYRGFNFSGSKSSLISAPRQPVFNFSTAETTTTEVTLGNAWSVYTPPPPPPPPPSSSSNGGGGGTVSSSGGGGSDPIAQTFWVDQASTSDNVLQVTSVDVFFSSKSTSGNGVTLQIYETVNGYPSSVMVPYGASRLDASDITVDDGTGTGNLTATTFTFDNPVTLSVGRDYCIIVQPDGNDPDYRVWTAKTGETDSITGVPVTQNVSAGVLFTSTNKRTWTPYQDENLTFKINKARYTSTSGTLNLKNSDHEFLDIQSFSNGPFIKGEKVFKVTSDSARTFENDDITFTSGSRTVTCTTLTTFTNVNEGDTIVVDYGASATPRWQSFTVESKATPIGGGEITLREPAYNSSNDATFYKTIVGTMDYFYESSIDLLIRMILKNSTADGTSSNAGDKFVNGDNIRGIDSDAQATVGTVTNLPVNAFNMNLYKTDYNRTRTFFKFFDTASTSLNVEKGATIHLNKDNYSIKSKSNMSSSDIPFRIRVEMNNITSTDETKDSSPVFDHEVTNGHIIEYAINNDTTGETGNQGNASSRYITSMITLADQMDATDLSVLLTAYRPLGTDIKVYGRFVNSSDLRAFDTVEWTELEKDDTTNIISTSANRYDFKEIEYRIPRGTPSAGQGAARIDEDSMNYIVGSTTFTSYKYFAIKIVLTTDRQYSIPRVRDMRAIALA